MLACSMNAHSLWVSGGLRAHAVSTKRWLRPKVVLVYAHFSMKFNLRVGWKPPWFMDISHASPKEMI